MLIHIIEIIFNMPKNIKRLNNKCICNQKSIKLPKQPSVEAYFSGHALIEWDPKHNGLIYGVVKFNTIYKPWEPTFKSFKIGEYYRHMNSPDSGSFACKLLFKGTLSECLEQLTNEYFKKNSWIQGCHEFDIKHNQCDECVKVLTAFE